MTQLSDLKPQADDLVVVPEGMLIEIPEGGLPFHVYQMKFLHKPSIIRTGTSNMAFLEAFRSSLVGQWLGLSQDLEPRTSLKDIIFDEESVHRLRDSQLPQTLGRGSQQRTHLESYNNSELKVLLEPRTAEAKFFRYGRMMDTIQHLDGISKVVAPKGGLTVYVELDAAHKTFAFSYALCYSSDNFNKSIGRDIAKGRFDNDDWYEIEQYDENISVLANIKKAIYNSLCAGHIGFAAEGARFSSISEKVNYYELELIFERIE